MDSLSAETIMHKLIPHLTLGLVILGCNSVQTSPSVAPTAEQAEQQPQEVKPLEMDSPASVTVLLERRWPLAAIETFCIPERRANPAYQNLVVEGTKWEGVLHSNQNDDSRRIFWYGNAYNGKLSDYSLNVQRGDDYWRLEIGNNETLNVEPDISPDSSLPYFVGPTK